MVKRVILIVILALMMPFFWVFPILAQEQRGDQNVILKSDEIVEGDLFASGNNVVISGTVNGDTYLAGGTVVVEGTINGDLLVAGGIVDIKGRVIEDVRAIGGQINVSGNIGGNISTITGQLILAPNAQVVGNLINLGSNPAQISPQAQILGQIIQNPPPQTPTFEQFRFFTQVSLIGALVSFLSSLVIGLLLLHFLPKVTQDIAAKAWNKPWLSLLIGFLTIIIFPILCLILLITLVGIPLALILAVSILIFMYLAKIFVAVLIGQKVFQLFKTKVASYWALILGLVIYELLLLIPIFGWIVAIVIILLGLGAILLILNDYYQRRNVQGQ